LDADMKVAWGKLDGGERKWGTLQSWITAKKKRPDFSISPEGKSGRWKIREKESSAHR